MRNSFPQILYVDDAEACEMAQLLLEQSENDYEITAASSPEEAFSLISQRAFDLYIFDNPWRKPTGLELCRKVREDHPKAPIVIFSVRAQDADREEALAAGANDYLIKPNDLNRLIRTIDLLLAGKHRIPAG